MGVLNWVFNPGKAASWPFTWLGVASLTQSKSMKHETHTSSRNLPLERGFPAHTSLPLIHKPVLGSTSLYYKSTLNGLDDKWRSTHFRVPGRCGWLKGSLSSSSPHQLKHLTLDLFLSNGLTVNIYGIYLLLMCKGSNECFPILHLQKRNHCTGRTHQLLATGSHFSVGRWFTLGFSGINSDHMTKKSLKVH